MSIGSNSNKNQKPLDSAEKDAIIEKLQKTVSRMRNLKQQRFEAFTEELNSLKKKLSDSESIKTLSEKVDSIMSTSEISKEFEALAFDIDALSVRLRKNDSETCANSDKLKLHDSEINSIINRLSLAEAKLSEESKAIKDLIDSVISCPSEIIKINTYIDNLKQYLKDVVISIDDRITPLENCKDHDAIMIEIEKINNLVVENIEKISNDVEEMRNKADDTIKEAIKSSELEADKLRKSIELESNKLQEEIKDSENKVLEKIFNKLNKLNEEIEASYSVSDAISNGIKSEFDVKFSDVMERVSELSYSLKEIEEELASKINAAKTESVESAVKMIDRVVDSVSELAKKSANKEEVASAIENIYSSIRNLKLTITHIDGIIEEVRKDIDDGEQKIIARLSDLEDSRALREDFIRLNEKVSIFIEEIIAKRKAARRPWYKKIFGGKN